MGRTISILAWITIGATFFTSPSLQAQEESSTLSRVPYLQRLLPQSVELRWMSKSSLDDLLVQLKAPDIPTRTFNSSQISKITFEEARGGVISGEHLYSIKIIGLNQNTKYTYEILDGATRLTPPGGFTFLTPQTRPSSFRLLVFGDSGTGSTAQHVLAHRMGELVQESRLSPNSPSIPIMGILHTGDFDYSSHLDKSLFTPYEKLLPEICFFPVWGNHDREGVQDVPAEILFTGTRTEENNSYYSLRWGNAHIVAFDTTLKREPEEYEAQIEWLMRDLEAARQNDAIKWILVSLHEPLFTTGPHAVDASYLPFRQDLAPIFEEFKVDVVFTGDDHNYQRSQPIKFKALDGPIEPPEDSYDLAHTEEGPHYGTQQGAPLDGRIYLVSGGGGQILYAANTGLDIDENFKNIGLRAFHFLDVEVTPKRLSIKAIDGAGETIDHFSISKIEGVRGTIRSHGSEMEITDVILQLGFLFLGEHHPCPALLNSNGADGFDVTDPIFSLKYLFLGGPPPASPFPNCDYLNVGSAHRCTTPLCKN